MIGITSLFVAGASEIRLAVSGDAPCIFGIITQVVVLDRASPSIVGPHSPVAILIDAVAAQSGIAALYDRYPDTGVSEDVVVLQHPLPVFVDEDAALLTIMDAVAAQARVSTIVDGNTCHMIIGDITSIQFQPPLPDVYTVPIPATHLSQGQVRHLAHRCFEQ